MRPRSRKSQLWLGFGGLLVALLLAGVFTLGSLDLPFEPRQWNQVLILYAVSTFIVAALLVFGLILTRTLLRLWAERRAEQLGSRFKTKMVLGAMATSLLPVVFMFFISYALLNRTLGRWFPRPLEIATEESQKLRNEIATAEHERLTALARDLAAQPRKAGLGGASSRRKAGSDPLLRRALDAGADAAWTLDTAGKLAPALARGPRRFANSATLGVPPEEISPRLVRRMPTGAELWETSGQLYLAARAASNEGALFVARRMPDDFLKRFTEIEAQTKAYARQKQQLRTYKTQLLLILFLFTLLVLFATTWFALFLSKQVTVPIQALAAATREVTAGHFDYRVHTQAQDELGVLVRSFNQMTAQLGESRRQIDEFTRSLQQAVLELERRRMLLEAILENIPTGVLSLDDSGAIVRVNSATAKIFGETARDARALADLMRENAARSVQQLMRRSLRMGVASKELEFALPGRVVHAAVTVSALGPRRSNPGFVVVVDDLSDLLRAQRDAAWQEVAQRIAHEIKNPLTPIQLSAQRLRRYLDRTRASSRADASPADRELAQLVGECAGLIEREVAALESLVDEFSQFARFPTARLVAADPNSIVASALEVFSGRLEGVAVRTEYADGLPSIKADAELLRRVVVNLIDNAAEAVEGSSIKEIALATRLDAGGETLKIIVADSGHGISPEDKNKMFLPHFSTKERGTGLGLAIASRIIAEHNGTLAVEDNFPVGARFVIRLPMADPASRDAAPFPSEA